MSVAAFTDPIRDWARRTPHRTAVVDRARAVRLDYAALDRAADGWATMLRARGLGAGDRVALLAANRHEHVALLFACLRTGAALVPLNWRLSDAELASVVADARPALLVCDDRFAERARALATAHPALPLLALDEVPGMQRAPHDDASAPPATGTDAPEVREPRDPEAPLLVLYTSGSTGVPKGAVLPYRQLLYNAIATTTAWELGAADVLPVSTPFFHTGGWNVFATPLWFVGGTVVLFDGFEPGDFLQGLADERCTLAFGVPTQLAMLLDHPAWRRLPALRGWLSGGAPCPPTVAERIRAVGYRFREGYGLTECGPNCFAITDDEAAHRPGVVGRPVPFLEMRLVDASGADVPVGEVGELLLRGPQLFAGYLHAPQRTAEALRDGWLHTGDLARREPDGAYRIAGRRKEMFISGGENVFPGEVEAALADCAGVGEVVVVGVPDVRWGEVGCAYLLPRAGATLHADDIRAHARTRLAGYKVPKHLVIVRELPRLGSGKPDRARLASAVAASARAECGVPAADAVATSRS